MRTLEAAAMPVGNSASALTVVGDISSGDQAQPAPSEALAAPNPGVSGPKDKR